MSDNEFPFGDVDSGADDDANGGSRRALVLGGAAAALVLTAGAFFVLGGGAEEEFAPVQRGVAPAAAAATPAPTAAVLPAPFDEDLGRDPFRALYVEPAAAPAAAEGSADDPTLPQGQAPAAPQPAQGDEPVAAPPPGSGSAGVPAAAPAAPEGPTAREHALVLKRVYGTGQDLTAEFTIDGRKVVAKVGVRFGPTDEIRLISLQQGPAASQWTAVLQVGDGEPFDAVTGETVSVR